MTTDFNLGHLAEVSVSGFSIGSYIFLRLHNLLFGEKSLCVAHTQERESHAQTEVSEGDRST